MKQVIKTNHHAYPILSYYDLTEKELREFNYWEKDKLEADSFVRYKGNIYSLSEFICYNVEGYDGVCPQTAFSGVLVKIINSDYVKMASYYN